MQLLKITTTPMKYELEIEHARLEHNSDFQPTADVTTTKPELRIKSKNAEARIDTYEARRSLGIQKIGDYIDSAAQNGKEAINQKTREYVEIGKEMSNTYAGATISNIYSQKMLNQSSQLVTVFLPSTGADISWNPAELSMSYEPGDVSLDWDTSSGMLSYVPGSVRMKILEYADISIEYLGEPLYVPPSANPDYVEPET